MPEPDEDREIRHRLAEDVLKGMERWHTASDKRRAKRYYFGSTDDTQLEDSEVNGFLQWYTSDFRDSATGRTLVEHYYETHGAQLEPRARLLLEVWRDSWPGVFEVEAVEEGRGIQLRDVASGETLFVHDVTASRELTPGMWTLCRIEKLEGKFLFVSDGSSVPPAVQDELLKLIGKESAAAGETRVEYVRRSGNTLYRKIRALSDRWLKNLRVVNREGDELAFCHADYSVRDEPALLAVLRSLEELNEDAGKPGEAHFGWMEPDTGGPRKVFGHVQVGGGHLRLEAQSRARLQLGRGLLETHAARLLKHREDSCRSLDEIKQRVAESPAAREPEPIPTQEEREIILQMKAEHYARWPDEPLPALGGKTARQAVKTKAGRKAVDGLIRHMERDEARESRAGQPAFNFQALRKALGLES